MTDALTEQIVSLVLERLQHDGVSLSSSNMPEQADLSDQSATLSLDEKVITAELLETHCQSGQRVSIPPKAIITPSARDWIKDHQLQVMQSETANESSTIENPWHAFQVGNGHQYLSILKGVETKQVDNTNQVTEQLIELLNRQPQLRVMVLTEKAATVCLQVNRHPAARAVVVRDQSGVRDSREIDANVICLPTVDLSHLRMKQIWSMLNTPLVKGESR